MNVCQRRYGTDVWTHRREDPDGWTDFDDAMQEGSAQRVAALIAAYDFAGFHTLVDVGGGRGSLLAGVLRAHPTLRGILYDQPSVAAGAATVLAEAGVADRCRIHGDVEAARVPGAPGRGALDVRREGEAMSAAVTQAASVVEAPSEEEFRALLARAGFARTRVVPTAGALSVVEAVPA